MWSIRKGKDGKILIVAHRVELIDQISESLTHYDISHGIIAGGKPRNLSHMVQVASVQTITHHSNTNVSEGLPVMYVIIDEAHHSVANSYKKLWKMYPKSKKLGVTATPWRMNSEGFESLYGCIIVSPSISDFIKEGWLAPYNYYSIVSKSEVYNRISNIHDFDIDGDYKVGAMEKAMDIIPIRAQLLESYLTLAKGRKGIIYAISRRHSEHICEEYRKVGINIVRIDSTTPRNERNLLVSRFRQGFIDIIVNVDIFSEGFDCPSIEFIQLARPTRSLVKYLQQVGRGLRPTEGKQKFLILDNVGAHLEFGFPDSDRNWEESFTGSKCPKISKSRKFATLIDNNIAEKPFFEEGTEKLELVENVEGTIRMSNKHVWNSDDKNLLCLLRQQKACSTELIASVFGCSEEEVKSELKLLGIN